MRRNHTEWLLVLWIVHIMRRSCLIKVMLLMNLWLLGRCLRRLLSAIRHGRERKTFVLFDHRVGLLVSTHIGVLLLRHLRLLR